MSTLSDRCVEVSEPLYEQLLARLGSHAVICGVVENLIAAELDRSAASAVSSMIAVTGARVTCSSSGFARPCRNVFLWRGELRCGCPRPKPKTSAGSGGDVPSPHG